ncbi:transketolase [Adlercreutzia murintestinalis]|uniref:transketolase n=1 Tax=Adlercreutzia murintestinalis TaxID=2941325 RepID=UPI003D80D589
MDISFLESTALQMRRDILTMIAEAGSGHPGGSLSCIDILCALYFGDVLDYDAAAPQKEGRDRFILAKGHAAPALYATLARAGFFPVDELLTLRKLGSRLQGHPDPQLCPGVEVSTGSLGQGLSVGCGLACGLRLNEEDGCVFVLLGDGECEEGQVWEAAMFAAHQRLGNLIAIVDGNGLQIDGHVSEVCDPADIPEKFRAFGWQVSQVDGHDLGALVRVLGEAKAAGGDAPHLIYAHTIKGKGVSFMEDVAGWHGKAPDADQLAQALAELDACEVTV